MLIYFLQHWPICLHGDENGLPKIPKDENGELIYDDDPTPNGTKYIDVYHKLEDILETTTKVRSIGVSNYSIPKLRQLLPKVKNIFLFVIKLNIIHNYLNKI